MRRGPLTETGLATATVAVTLAAIPTTQKEETP